MNNLYLTAKQLEEEMNIAMANRNIVMFRRTIKRINALSLKVKLYVERYADDDEIELFYKVFDIINSVTVRYNIYFRNMYTY